MDNQFPHKHFIDYNLLGDYKTHFLLVIKLILDRLKTMSSLELV